MLNQAADLHHCELDTQVQMYIYWTPRSLSSKDASGMAIKHAVLLMWHETQPLSRYQPCAPAVVTIETAKRRRYLDGWEYYEDDPDQAAAHPRGSVLGGNAQKLQGQKTPQERDRTTNSIDCPSLMVVLKVSPKNLLKKRQNEENSAAAAIEPPSAKRHKTAREVPASAPGPQKKLPQIRLEAFFALPTTEMEGVLAEHPAQIEVQKTADAPQKVLDEKKAKIVGKMHDIELPEGVYKI